MCQKTVIPRLLTVRPGLDGIGKDRFAHSDARLNLAHLLHRLELVLGVAEDGDGPLDELLFLAKLGVLELDHELVEFVDAEVFDSFLKLKCTRLVLLIGWLN
jgi:hypothetical protein